MELQLWREEEEAVRNSTEKRRYTLLEHTMVCGQETHSHELTVCVADGPPGKAALCYISKFSRSF